MPGACEKLFEAATPPSGEAPSDTLFAAQNIARYPWHKAQKLFGLFDELYPVPAGKLWRKVPHIAYLNFAPSAWNLSLVYAGGGLNSLGGIAIDGEGNLWADDNFLVGAQSTIYAGFGGGLSKAVSGMASPRTARSRSRPPSIWPSISRTGFGSPIAAPTR